MFSPIGKKKILLELKMGGTDPNDMAAVVKSSENSGKLNRSPSPPKSRSVNTNSDIVVASKSNLEKALENDGILGNVMNRILESTVRYRPEKDGVVLKAFQTKCIDFDRFRNYLYSMFWLTFSEDEYKALVSFFDPQSCGVINGYDFMIAFIKLGSIRKNRESNEVKAKQEAHVLHLKDEEDRKRAEQDKRKEQAVDMDFSEEVKETALKKLSEAATKFDPKHPSSPSLEAFSVSHMNPADFRESLKLTFNLKLDRQELGAVLKAFGGVKGGGQGQLVSCPEFMRNFLRLGIDGRDAEKVAQRQRQAELDEKEKQSLARKKAEADLKQAMEVDYNYDHHDEASAMDKLKSASCKYDKNAPGCPSLDGFEVETLSPGDFKD
jgi:hypothetical protein